MRALLLGMAVLMAAAPAGGVEKAELDHRIRKLGDKLEAMQQKPEKRIPPDLLRKAHGVVLLDRTKAGFIFAYQGGGGVAMVRDARLRTWSPAAFVSASEASIGAQIGGQQSFFVILLMTTNAVTDLTQTRFVFGGEAQGTAGNTSGGVEGKVSSGDPAVLVYSDRKGLFGGAAVKGGAFSPDENANRVYYDQYVTMEDILFDRKVQSTPTATELARKLAEYSR